MLEQKQNWKQRRTGWAFSKHLFVKKIISCKENKLNIWIVHSIFNIFVSNLVFLETKWHFLQDVWNLTMIGARTTPQFFLQTRL